VHGPAPSDQLPAIVQRRRDTSNAWVWSCTKWSPPKDKMKTCLSTAIDAFQLFLNSGCENHPTLRQTLGTLIARGVRRSSRVARGCETVENQKDSWHKLQLSYTPDKVGVGQGVPNVIFSGACPISNNAGQQVTTILALEGFPATMPRTLQTLPWARRFLHSY